MSVCDWGCLLMVGGWVGGVLVGFHMSVVCVSLCVLCVCGLIAIRLVRLRPRTAKVLGECWPGSMLIGGLLRADPDPDLSAGGSGSSQGS